MSEIYNAIEGSDKRTWFNHLLLGYIGVRDITKQENFDASKLEVELTINGMSLGIEDFNAVMGEWSDRIEAQVKDKLDYLEKENSVAANAEKLLKRKLRKAFELLQGIEDDVWKLYED